MRWTLRLAKATFVSGVLVRCGDEADEALKHLLCGRSVQPEMCCVPRSDEFVLSHERFTVKETRTSGTKRIAFANVDQDFLSKHKLKLQVT